ncbi:MAG TPA: hypothetical protein VHR66_26035 [Gemmataceae bacterium]|nr:hypothetical protein [Gemmataceae bacterium]
MEPEVVLDRYHLTPRERRRLQAVVGQRGMATNCSLYRVNRITPIYTLLPYTCFVLGDDLAREAELFWDSFADTDLQFQKEVGCFAAFLHERVRTKQLTNPFLMEVLGFELAVNELKYLPRRQIAEELCRREHSNPSGPLQLHPLIRIVPFRHEPAQMLHALAQMVLPSFDFPTNDYFLLLDAAGEELDVKRIDPSVGRVLQAIVSGADHNLAPDDADALVQSGLLVRGPLRLAGEHAQDKVGIRDARDRTH